jgi:hypothetical protein
MNRIGLGILFYNELENAKRILKDIREFELQNIDFYFLDNGSNNPEFSEWLMSIKDENVNILQVKENLGFGGGAKYLIQNIPNEFRGYMPGNYKVRPESLRNLNLTISETNDIQIFKATRAGRSFIDQAKTFAVGLTTSTYFLTNMMDSGGTPTVIKGDLAEIFQSGPNDFSFEAYILYTARKLKLNIKRTPINYGVRIHGVSHWQSGIKSELKLLSRIVKQKNNWEKLSR